MTITSATATTAAASGPAPSVLREHRIPAHGMYEGPRDLRRVPEGWADRSYENDYGPHRRVAERVAIAGDRPF